MSAGAVAQLLDDLPDLAAAVTHDQLLDGIARASRFASTRPGGQPAAAAFLAFLCGNLDAKRPRKGQPEAPIGGQR